MAETYPVAKGDTLSAIAKKYGTTVAKFKAANPSVTDPSKLKVGQVLNIPTGSKASTDTSVTNNVSSTVTGKQDSLDMEQLADEWSVAAAYLGTDKSLQDALNRIMGVDASGKKISGMITDKNLQIQVLKSTDWYKQSTDDWRKFQVFKNTNPGQFSADLQTNAQAIVKNYASAGITIDADKAVKLAEQMMMKSAIIDGKTVLYDQDYMRKTMAQSIDFNKTKTVNNVKIYDLSGGLETLSNQLYKTAWDYGFPATTSNAGFSTWFEKTIKGLVDGTVNKEDVDNELQARAISMFPGLTQQIQSGQTLRQAADPWLNAISSELETDPNSLDLNNDTVQQVLNYQDEKGNVSPMNLYSARKKARKDPKWDFTQKAKEEKTGIANRILQDFGFLG